MTVSELGCLDIFSPKPDSRRIQILPTRALNDPHRNKVWCDITMIQSSICVENDTLQFVSLVSGSSFAYDAATNEKLSCEAFLVFAQSLRGRQNAHFGLPTSVPETKVWCFEKHLFK